MITPLIAANWKLHKLPSEGVAWLETLLRELPSKAHEHVQILLNVPATHLAPMARLARGTPVALGGQDLSAHDEGAYTGEVSGAMLSDTGASFVIVGHSERRTLHGESDELVNRKLKAARRNDLVPILCVGESEAERDAGEEALAVVLEQLRTGLRGLCVPESSALVIAYEPVWAIGTGRTATADDAQSMAATIRSELRTLYPAVADGIRLLYGGSMKPANAAKLLSCADVNGGLIGGASLELNSLLAIAKAAG